MTEAEALKQFIPILGRISPPGERATITRNILERIAGNQTCIMGVSHKQAGALAWPGDPVKASEYENSLNAAVDAGDFVSLLHRADRRHFQIEELTSWPDCPAISPDSPLTFWLGEPAPAQSTVMPAPVVELEAQRGYLLALPSGQTHVQFGELAHLIADALWPDAGADDTRMTYGFSRVNLDAELVQAVKAGTLQVKDPLTFGPHTFPVGNALLSALVTVDDLREFVAARGLTVETAQTHDTTPSPAPVLNASASGGVEADKAGPRPLTTNEIANCFDGFRDWDVKRWKRELGSPDNWLKDCQHSKGTRGRGGYESTWWPVKIAIALASQDQKSARHLPARFKRLEQLKPWIEELEINIP